MNGEKHSDISNDFKCVDHYAAEMKGKDMCLDESYWYLNITTESKVSPLSIH